MEYAEVIRYIEFDIKIFIIFFLSFINVVLILLILKNKIRVMRKNKVIIPVIITLFLLACSTGLYFSYSAKDIVPNKYYDNKFSGVYTNKYINAVYYKNIGYKYLDSEDTISRNALTIERNTQYDEFILEYTIDGKEKDSYLFTNVSPLIKENEIYKGYQTICHMKNYGTTLDLDMSFDTSLTKEYKIEFEVYSIDGEKLDSGEIQFYKNSVSHN